MPAPLTLDSPVSQLGGGRLQVKLLRALEQRQIRTVRDLLLDLPYAWDDFVQSSVRTLEAGRPATITVTLESIRTREVKFKRMSMTEATAVGDEGDVLRVVWFRQPWVARQYRPGDRIVLAGVPKPAGRGGGFEMLNPKSEKALTKAPTADAGRASLGGLTPRYHVSKGADWAKVAALVREALPLADQLQDTLPAATRARQGLLSLSEAVRLGHQPNTKADWTAARKRMAFAQLLELQAAFIVVRRRLQVEPAEPVPYRQDVIDVFKAGLGFELTHAQKRSLWEIFQDMAESHPMNRLLNGDVGSGKTAVAAGAIAMAHAAGRQSVVMAPTEILARQHLHKFRSYLEDSFPGLRVELLISGLPAAERRRVTTAAASGQCALLVGTHALIEDSVEIANLGLAIVDEQHRFGTRQRELLRGKGRGRPHFLAMTATPIPRTLALARYGEMTVSLINEMPPGRTPVRTEVIPPDRRHEAYALVRAEVAAGHQAFVICPLIDESDKLQAKAATVEYERLKNEVFTGLRVAMVHGRLKEKDEVMRAFAEGQIDVLVATSVVEVGVDVPAATVMMIEGAERFGLAQLHQFRGRVGRGDQVSHCLLLESEPVEGGDLRANERLGHLARIHDGFRLAEMDMRIRGAGELIGQRQHGQEDVAMESLSDPELLNEIRAEAELVLEADPELDHSPALREAILRRLELTSIS